MHTQRMRNEETVLYTQLSTANSREFTLSSRSYSPVRGARGVGVASESVEREPDTLSLYASDPPPTGMHG